MADELVKILEGEKGVDVQAAVDAWIATLTAGYVINEMAISQGGSPLRGDRVVLAIKFVDGT